MKYQELKKYYLCGIGTKRNINDYKVGIYDSERQSFYFSNADYGNIELFREPKGSNSTYVISDICLQNIEDAELLHRENVIAGVDFSEDLDLLENKITTLQ